MQVEDGSQLTQSGKDEMLEMGRRYRQRFPGLLDQPYTEDQFQVNATLTRKRKTVKFQCPT